VIVREVGGTARWGFRGVGAVNEIPAHQEESAAEKRAT